MSENVYANLLGKWVNLNDDPSCVMGPNMVSPTLWWEENAEMYAPINRPEPDSFYHENYLIIHYQNRDYRVQPCHIQIVSE